MQLYRHLTANHITLEKMDFVGEIPMEAYLIENPDILALDEDDLSTVEIVEAQVPVPRGRESKHKDGRCGPNKEQISKIHRHGGP
jgi:hypothetical protein